MSPNLNLKAFKLLDCFKYFLHFINKRLWKCKIKHAIRACCFLVIGFVAEYYCV